MSDISKNEEYNCDFSTGINLSEMHGQHKDFINEIKMMNVQLEGKNKRSEMQT